jgi:hypothetical protein
MTVCTKTPAYIVSFVLVIENSTQNFEINFLIHSRTARLFNDDHSLNFKRRSAERLI